MKSIFLGITCANILLLVGVFVLGVLAVNIDVGATSMYEPHIIMGIIAGLMALATHITTYTYFIATTKWLTAACETGAIDESKFVVVAKGYKKRVFGTAMSAIFPTMIAMFAGAGADSVYSSSLWSPKVHMALAIFAIGMNIFAAKREYGFIVKQKVLMDEALAILNDNPNVVVQED